MTTSVVDLHVGFRATVSGEFSMLGFKPSEALEKGLGEFDSHPLPFPLKHRGKRL